jgi:hypothetical protein
MPHAVWGPAAQAAGQDLTVAAAPATGPRPRPLADSSASSACCGRHSTSCRCGPSSSPNQVGAASRLDVVRKKSQHMRCHPVRCEQAAAECRVGMCGILEDGRTNRRSPTNQSNQGRSRLCVDRWNVPLVGGGGGEEGAGRGRAEGTHCRLWRRGSGGRGGGGGWSGCRGCDREEEESVTTCTLPTDSRGCFPTRASETSRRTARDGAWRTRGIAATWPREGNDVSTQGSRVGS